MCNLHVRCTFIHLDVELMYIQFISRYVLCIRIGKSMYKHSYVDVRSEICLVSSTHMTAIEIHNSLLRGNHTTANFQNTIT